MKCCLLFFLLIALPARAKTIIISTPGADPRDYRAFVTASPAYGFPSVFFAGQLPALSSRQTLAERFAKAQLSFTSGSLNQAAADFRSVAALASTDQWDGVEQSVLLHSYLRLAQLEPGPGADMWMTLANLWARRGEVESGFFPPPLMTRFKEIQSQVAMRVISADPWRSNFRFLFINGEKFDLQAPEEIKIPEGAVRVTFLSDTYKPVTTSLTADRLASYRPAKIPFVEGTCHHATIAWEEKDVSVKPFFDVACALPTPLAKPAPPNIDFAKPSFQTPLPVATNFLPSNIPERPFYKRTWFWVGVGAVLVTSVILVAQANQHKSSAQPTTADGF